LFLDPDRAKFSIETKHVKKGRKKEEKKEMKNDGSIHILHYYSYTGYEISNSTMEI